MSTILKALKKLEEDQARQSATTPAGHGGQFVSTDRTKRWWSLLLIACGVGVGLLLAGTAYLFSGHRDFAQETMPIPAAERKSTAAVNGESPGTVPAESPPRIIAQPQKPARVTVREKSPVALSPPASPTVVGSASSSILPPLPSSRPALKPAPARPVADSPAPKNSQSLPVVTPPAGPVSVAPLELPPAGGPVEQVQVERMEIPRPGQQWVAPHLLVSEIIAASGGERMAIVNGLPVMAGTVVEDALVREIHPDRVVFDIDGKRVVVPLRDSP